MINKAFVQKHFDRSVSQYDKGAGLHRFIADKLLAMASLNGHKKNILEIGCGTGYLTSLICSGWNPENLTAVDISNNMIESTKERCLVHDNIEFIRKDGERLSFEDGRKFDLVVSSSTFQWFNDIYSSFKHYHSMIEDGGEFLFSMFVEDTFCELFQAFEKACIINKRPAMKPGQKLFGVGKVREFLRAAGFKEKDSFFEKHVVTFSSFDDLREKIKKMGFSNSNEDIGYISKRVAFDLKKIYAAEFCNDKKEIQATYSVFYYMGKK